MEKSIVYNLRLLNINCYISDEADADEVFLKFNGKKIWPKSKYEKMKDGSLKLNVEIKVEKDSKNILEIWDYDFWTPNDKLGTLTINADKMGGPFTTDFTKTDKGTSRYSVEWEMM